MIELTLRIVFSLAVVFGLMWGLAKLARRPLAARSGGMLDVLARQQLTRNSSIAIVRVADRALVLGVTDAGVSLLADADAQLFEVHQPERNVRRTKIDLNGSVLAPSTWRDAVGFLKGGRR